MAVILAPTARAQENPAVGIEGGVNIGSASLTGSGATGVTPGMKAGALVGGFVWWPIKGMFGLQPEVVWTQQPFKISGSERGTTFEATIRSAFVEIPVLARLNAWQSGSRAFYVVAGPGFKIKTRLEQTDSLLNGRTPPPNTFNDEDLKDQTRSGDVSLIVGAGFMAGPIGIEGRYDGGLLNLNNTCNTTGSNCLDQDLTVKENKTFTILGRWAFSIKK